MTRRPLPGERLRAFASRFCTPAAMERLIDPAIADLQSEHREALRRGRVWRSRCVRLAGYVGVWKVLGLHAAARSVPLVREWAAADDRAMGRTLAFSMAPIAIFTAVTGCIPLSYVIHMDALGYYAKVTGTELCLLLLYVVPSALPCGLPVGFACGIVCGLRCRAATPRICRGILLIATGCSVLIFVVLAWVLPDSNHAFHEIVAGGHVERGAYELSIGEMWTRGMQFEVQMILALACAPIILGLFAYGVSAAARGTWGSVAIGIAAAIAYIAQYWLLPAPGPTLAWWLPPFIAAWTPNLLFSVMTAVLLRIAIPPKQA